MCNIVLQRSYSDLTDFKVEKTEETDGDG